MLDALRVPELVGSGQQGSGGWMRLGWRLQLPRALVQDCLVVGARGRLDEAGVGPGGRAVRRGVLLPQMKVGVRVGVRRLCSSMQAAGGMTGREMEARMAPSVGEWGVLSSTTTCTTPDAPGLKSGILVEEVEGQGVIRNGEMCINLECDVCDQL